MKEIGTYWKDFEGNTYQLLGYAGYGDSWEMIDIKYVGDGNIHRVSTYFLKDDITSTEEAYLLDGIQ